MDHTAHTSRPQRPAGLREASLHDLIMDTMRLGPAPTRSRELFVIVIAAVLSLVLIGVVGWPVGYIVAAVVTVHLAIRWVIGVRRWGSR